MSGCFYIREQELAPTSTAARYYVVDEYEGAMGFDGAEGVVADWSVAPPSDATSLVISTTYARTGVFECLRAYPGNVTELRVDITCLSDSFFDLLRTTPSLRSVDLLFFSGNMRDVLCAVNANPGITALTLRRVVAGLATRELIEMPGIETLCIGFREKETPDHNDLYSLYSMMRGAEEERGYFDTILAQFTGLVSLVIRGARARACACSFASFDRVPTLRSVEGIVVGATTWRAFCAWIRDTRLETVSFTADAEEEEGWADDCVAAAQANPGLLSVVADGNVIVDRILLK